MPPEVQQNKRAIKVVKRLFYSVVIISIIAFVSIGTTIWLYLKIQRLQSDGPIFQADATNGVIKSVGKLMVLPTNETPTVATVTDLSKLKDQPFFAKAKLGDKVLIYTGAKKAILYRPSTNQLIEVSPLQDTSVNSETATRL